MLLLLLSLPLLLLLLLLLSLSLLSLLLLLLLLSSLLLFVVGGVGVGVVVVVVALFGVVGACVACATCFGLDLRLTGSLHFDRTFRATSYAERLLLCGCFSGCASLV